MQSGVEQFVKTKVDVPVHLVYFTAVVDDAGTLTFPRDIYGYDARQKNGELKSKS
jgi:murein L,D-transpeptidase YcbB/YkuD